MKNKFKEIVKDNIKREGIKELMEDLEMSDFYTSPGSAKYHHSYKGGLLEHSLEVYEFLVEELKGNDDYTLETITIVALFHDICKIGYYDVSTRNTKDESGKWIQVPYYTVNDLLPLGHGEKSVIMLMERMELTSDEILAIRWHMGLSVPKEEYYSMSKAFEECPLALYLHISDMKSTYLTNNRK